MFRYTYSHGLVSLPFLGAIHDYFDATNEQLIKNALAELYSNLSYITLSGAILNLIMNQISQLESVF